MRIEADRCTNTNKSHYHIQVASPRGTMEEGQIFQGISADLLLDVLTPLREGVMPSYRALGVEMDYFSITEARDLGLDWAR